jgi:hypothetical protein
MALTPAQRTRRLNTAQFNNAEKLALSELLDSVQTDLTAVQTSITNLNAWATALATKLNADAGVTDVNYDTNPQA